LSGSPDPFVTAEARRWNSTPEREETVMVQFDRFAVVVLVIACALALTLAAPPVDAQSDVAAAPAVESHTYGTAAEISHTVGHARFTPRDFSGPDTYDSSGLGGAARFCLAVSCNLVADVLLPAGARVTRIEADGCDTNAGQNFNIIFFKQTPHLGSETTLATATSSGSAGCAYFTATLPTPETIDNHNNNYYVEFNSPVAGSSLKIQAVRLFYTLQVSPAPGSATFGDVPTSHPFFQFVEALVASGITAGCGGANYCPDAPLTRGQMAVFLSKALGLHFAP
jgi:hypothetical protein